ncbi:MAG: YihY/virulence factor BrkB family protein [Bacteroidetes bacterium]|nr:YihY/virulence factor BrkB family protein [Bacteroidota bacterium]MBS1608233.1 YihY/virulence factor BrkB family protein [Bacteroidota bacterium]
MIKILRISRDIFISSPPVKLIIGWSKRIHPPGFQGIPLHDVIKFFFEQVRKVGMVERASAISFNIVMAIPPAIIFLFTLIPYLPFVKQFTSELYRLIRDVIPGQKNNSVIITFLNDFINHPRNGLLSIGFILALFYSSNAMMGIMRSFDKNYIGFKKRKPLQQRGVAIKLTLIMFLIVFSSILLMVLQGAMLKWLGIQRAEVRDFIKNVRWIVIILLFFYSVSYIYRHAPSVDKKWRLLNPGSILATLLMLLFTLLFSYWVNNFASYNKLYGSISAVIILMLLIYFNSLVLLIGFELNVSISSLKRLADDERQKLKAV